MKKGIVSFVFLLVGIVLVVGCGKKMGEKEYFDMAYQFMGEEKWSESEKYFQKILDEYPKGEFSSKALFMVGFVNANYAIPGDNLGITSVTQRYYLGPCMSEEDFNQIFSYFNEKSEEIYKLLESFEYLPEREKNWAIEYLDEFFQNAGNSRYIINKILSTCR